MARSCVAVAERRLATAAQSQVAVAFYHSSQVLLLGPAFLLVALIYLSWSLGLTKFELRHSGL